MTGYTVQSFSAGDTSEVLAVINRDQIAGQPLVTEQMLAEALAGRNDVDSGWWAELSNMVTEVAVATDGQITGAISYTRRARDNADVILWLHAGLGCGWTAMSAPGQASG